MAKVRIVDKEEWRAFVEHCPEATFFHSPEWYELWEKYMGYRSEARLISFPSGRETLMPLAWKPALKGMIRSYHSSPGGTYGGFITRDELSKEEKKELTSMMKQMPSVLLQFGPNAKLKELATREGFTQMVRLDQSDLGANWSKNHQRCLKKGLAIPYRVEVASDLEDWKTYYQIYLKSIDRWGNMASNRYQWKMLDLIRQLPAAYRRLWVHYQRETMTAGCLCFYYKDQVIYWHGAARKDCFRFYPNHLLHYHVMEDAQRVGYKSYDLNPSGGHEGVVRFKSGFGPVRIAAPVYSGQIKSVKLAYQFIDQIKKWC